MLPDPSIVADRDKALRYWDEHHFDSSALQENKQLLRQHYCKAKQLGDKVQSHVDSPRWSLCICSSGPIMVMMLFLLA